MQQVGLLSSSLVVEKPGQWPGFFSRTLQEQKCRQPITLFTVFWPKADRVEQFRVWGIFRSGSAGLGFQKGNLRSPLPGKAHCRPSKVADPRLALSGYPAILHAACDGRGNEMALPGRNDPGKD